MVKEALKFFHNWINVNKHNCSYLEIEFKIIN